MNFVFSKLFKSSHHKKTDHQSHVTQQHVIQPHDIQLNHESNNTNSDLKKSNSLSSDDALSITVSSSSTTLNNKSIDFEKNTEAQIQTIEEFNTCQSDTYQSDTYQSDTYQSDTYQSDTHQCDVHQSDFHQNNLLEDDTSKKPPKENIYLTKYVFSMQDVDFFGSKKKDFETFCDLCKEPIRAIDIVSLNRTDNFHKSCIKYYIERSIGHQHNVVALERWRHCFNPSLKFVNANMMTIIYTRDENTGIFCYPDTETGYKYTILNNSFVPSKLTTQRIPKFVTSYVMLLEDSEDETRRLYHHICSIYDYLHYMNLSKQKNVFTSDLVNLPNMQDLTYDWHDTAFYGIRSIEEYENHAVIKYTKHNRFLLYPKSRCPVCSHKKHHNYRHASVTDYIFEFSEKSSKVYTSDD